MDFEELFDNYFTSKNDLEKNIADLQKESIYDSSFSQHCRNEEKGTAFFEKFVPVPGMDLANPPFEVSPFKTFVLGEKPDLLRR